MNEDDVLLYDLCSALCKPIKDNKFPVNRALLQELCGVAPKLLQSYDALLVRAILLCVWGGFLRCCEYTEVQQSRKNHNMRSTVVNIMPDGVGLTFYTDKISVVNEQPKYQMISWSFLPAGVRQMLEEYDAQRPREADYFFVREDGTPLARDDFVNLFELCLLHTRWHFSHVVPHALLGLLVTQCSAEGGTTRGATYA